MIKILQKSNWSLLYMVQSWYIFRMFSYLNNSRGQAKDCALRFHSDKCDRYLHLNCYTRCGCFQIPCARLPCHIHHPIPNSQYLTNSSRLFVALASLPLLLLKRAHVRPHIQTQTKENYERIKRQSKYPKTC